tara:strand:+ start:832 stop:1131 length:300 start_codon:yes stop_codon:yes gene_type:complete
VTNNYQLYREEYDKLANIFYTPDTLKEVQEYVHKQDANTIITVGIVQNYLSTVYNKLVEKHNKLLIKLDHQSKSSSEAYDEGYRDGWDDCLKKHDMKEE